MGLKVTHCRSRKQTLNKKRSTEAELVGASDYMPYNIWYIIFIHHQGYLNKENNFFQYIKSAMRMDINGRNSCTGNYWHISIIYLSIKDRVIKRELIIMYCTTHLILPDYSTKSL